MIYTAQYLQSGSKIPQSTAFMLRKIPSHTQGKLSDLTISAKPEYPQLAYDGYKANIEAFLYATHMKERTRATFAAYPFLIDYDEDIDLPLKAPHLAFSPKVDLTDAHKKAMMERWNKYKIEEITLSNKARAYVLNSPDFKLVPSLLKIAKGEMGTPEGYTTVSSYPHIAKLYKILELFLRTNTYPAFRSIPEQGDQVLQNMAHIQVESHVRKYVEEDIPRKHATTETRVRRRDEEAEVEVSEKYAYCTEVLNAKPSPMPASTCYGSPSSTPNLPGLLFPYFDGMITADPSWIRTTVLELFFRLLPNVTDDDVRESYKTFKNQIAPFAYTSEGKVYSHILKGVKLALEAQAQLYLLFDKHTYLGFTLLGACFSVYDGRNWVSPLEPEALRAELSTLFTHEGRVEELAKLMSVALRLDGKKERVFVNDISTPVRLAKKLAALDLNKEKEIIREIEEHIRNLSFDVRFHPFEGPYILKQIPRIFAAQPIYPEDDEPLYIPTGSLELLQDLRNWHLLAFGPTCPSFYSATGAEYFIPDPKAKDVHFPDDVNKPNVLHTFIITPKVPKAAAADVQSVIAKHSVRFDTRERAAKSRCVVFKSKVGKEIWNAFKETVGKMDVSSKAQMKKKGAMDVDEEVDLDDVFANL